MGSYGYLERNLGFICSQPHMEVYRMEVKLLEKDVLLIQVFKYWITQNDTQHPVLALALKNMSRLHHQNLLLYRVCLFSITDQEESRLLLLSVLLSDCLVHLPGSFRWTALNYQWRRSIVKNILQPFCLSSLGVWLKCLTAISSDLLQFLSSGLYEWN